MTKGVLYVVATPIGSLDDITYRAVKILREVDFIVCEDTRKSRVLLNRWEARAPLVSLHRFSEAKKTASVLEKLEIGNDAALITDAGTPGISDPGHRLVRAALDAGFRVCPIPGASSVTAALSASGLDVSSFIFRGFAPRTTEKRLLFFDLIKRSDCASVFFETALRIKSCLEIAAERLGSRKAVLWREMTKVHEEVIRGGVRDILDALMERPVLKGEIVVIVEGGDVGEPQLDADLDEAVRTLIKEGFTGKRLAEEARRRFGVAKTESYRRFLEQRDIMMATREETQ